MTQALPTLLPLEHTPHPPIVVMHESDLPQTRHGLTYRSWLEHLEDAEQAQAVLLPQPEPLPLWRLERRARWVGFIRTLAALLLIGYALEHAGWPLFVLVTAAVLVLLLAWRDASRAERAWRSARGAA